MQQNKQYITLIWFKAFNHEQTAFYLDNHIPMRHVVSRRIRDICPTMKIHQWQTFEAFEIK